MQAAIRAAGSEGDSVGGILETIVTGLPAGIGEPWFDSVESELAHLMFAIPACKGIEFGAGFGFAAMHGSEANDPFTMRDAKSPPPRTRTAASTAASPTVCPSCSARCSSPRPASISNSIPWIISAGPMRSCRSRPP